MADADLLWVAQQGLTAALPEGWVEHRDEETGEPYFHNEAAGQSSWEHPADDYYRKLYRTRPGPPPGMLTRP